MSKFKIKVKLTGFELEIEGDRQDIPALTRSVSKQLGGMIAPPSADIFEDAEVLPNTVAALPEAKKPAPKKKRASSPKGSKSGASSSKEVVTNIVELDARAIQEKYGTPRQQWASADKLMWLLYVVEKEVGMQGLSSAQLKETFNTYFKTTGAVTGQNVADLRKKVVSNPSLLGKDTGKEPVTWYLIESGIKHVEGLMSPGSSVPE